MTKYKILVSLDGNNFFWIVIDREMLIKNPTKEDLICTDIKSYNPTNICPMCKEDKEIYGKELTDNSILYPKNARHKTDKQGNLTKEYVCRIHGTNSYDRYDLNSRRNIMKSISHHKTGNLNPNSNQAKGDKFQELTCRWRSTISTIPVEDLNKKLDNYHNPIDHSVDSELGILQTKGCLYNTKYKRWSQDFRYEYNKKFDFLILYCANGDGKIIERIYIIPKKDVIRISGISIKKDPIIYKNPWHGQYRIKDEEIIKNVNEIWMQILEGTKKI